MKPFVWCLLFSAAFTAHAAVAPDRPARVEIRVPAGEVTVALQQMAAQTGMQIIFRPDALAGVQARAVHGSYFPQEALDLLLAGTPLVAVPDKASGAFAVIFRDTVRDARAPVASAPPEPRSKTGAESPGVQSPQEPPMQTKKSLLSRIFGTLFAHGDAEASNSAASRKNGGAGLRAAVGLAVVSAAGVAPNARAQVGVGTVEGRVQSAATGQYLNNARVVAEGTNVEAMTDSDGSFRLANVPAGTARLRVTYTGMETQTATLNVAAGATARRDFALSFPSSQTTVDDKELVKLEQFVVEATQIGAVAAAQNERKIAPNIKEVVVLQEIGDLGDANLGEYLKYVPGVSARVAPDVATALNIRGMPAETVVILQDGHELANNAEDRVFYMPGTASTTVDRIEVTKVPTPDRPANAVGGTVNIISKSALGKKRQLRLDVGGSYNSWNRWNPPGLNEQVRSDGWPSSLTGKMQPVVNIAWSHPVNEKFAYTLHLTRQDRLISNEFNYPQWDLVARHQTQSQIQGNYSANERGVIAAGFDWRLGPRDTLRGNFQNQTDRRAGVGRPRFIANMAAGGTTVLTGATPYAVGAPAGTGFIRNSTDTADTKNYTDTVGLRYKHDGDLYKIDVAASISAGATWSHGVDEGFFTSSGDMQISNLIVRADGIDTIFARRAPRYSAVDRTGRVYDPYDISFYTVPSPVNANLKIKSSVKSLSGDVARSFTAPVPTMLKAGFLATESRKDKVQPNQVWNFTPPAGVATTVGNYDLIDNGLSSGFMLNGTLPMKFVSNRKLYNFVQAHPTWFTFDTVRDYTRWAQNSTFFKENIYAAYLRGDVKLLNNRLWLVGGARYEKTDDFGAGLKDDVGATYQKDANGRVLRDSANRPILATTDALALAKLRYTTRGARASRDYSGTYGSLNASYYVTDNLVVRTAFAQTMGRPNLTEIIPGMTVPDPTSTSTTLTLVNTALNPWTAKNYDLSLEAYEWKGATVAFSLFRKDVRNFFVGTVTPVTPEQMELYGLDPAYSSYMVAEKINSPDPARVEGYEFSWRQAWFFLPHWAKGFSTYANVTINHRYGPSAANLSSVNSGFAHRTINTGITYTRGNFQLRFNQADVSRIIQYSVGQNATTPANVFFSVAPQIYQEWNAEYRFLKRFSAYVSCRNWNGGTDARDQAAPDTPRIMRPRQYKFFGTATTFGIRSDF